MGNKHIAKIENTFVLKAHYALTAVEQKLILYLINRLDPKKDKSFFKQIVPIKDIEKVLWQKDKKGKFGALYEYMNEVCSRLLNRQISFPKGTIINEKKVIGGSINWFQSILVLENDEGDVSIEFMFSERMKPFLLELNRYVRINTMEVMDMRGTHSIRMYQVFKAERERTKKFKRVTHLVYNLDELKAFLGVGGKYKAIKDFKKWVLEPLKREINEYSKEISVNYVCLKTRRRITGIDFEIYDKQESPVLEVPIFEDYVPNEEEIKTLTWGRRLAYTELVEFGVKEGIAFKRILPTIGGSELEGFEDFFVKYAIEHFKKWSKNQKNKEMGAGTFVKWWLDKKVFDNNSEGNVWGKILDKVTTEKKNLDKIAFDNRVVAKEMTETEFKEWYRKNKSDQKKEEIEV